MGAFLLVVNPALGRRIPKEINALRQVLAARTAFVGRRNGAFPPRPLISSGGEML